MVTHGHGRCRRGARPHCVGAVVHIVALVLIAIVHIIVHILVVIVVMVRLSLWSRCGRRCDRSRHCGRGHARPHHGRPRPRRIIVRVRRLGCPCCRGRAGRSRWSRRW